jgi:hypothetical protein
VKAVSTNRSNGWRKLATTAMFRNALSIVTAAASPSKCYQAATGCLFVLMKGESRLAATATPRLACG